MTRAPHLCTCGCGNIIPHGEQCDRQKEAARARKARHDRRRPSAAKRGYNREWRSASKEYLARHRYCRFLCGRLATVVDHVIPHKGDQRLFWFRGNWQPLCKTCHDREKQRRERHK